MAGISDLFDTKGFPARWDCGVAWHESPIIGWIHIVSDIAIASAYYAIPLSLAFFLWRRRDIPFHKIAWLFILFIASCGTVHLIEASIFWWPVYRLSAAGKVLTAVVSWGTVIALVPAIPKALRLPGLERRNDELQREIGNRQEAEQRLRMLTTALERSNAELEQYARVASHDLQEPLRKIEAFSSIMTEDFPAMEPECREHLDRIRSASVRMRQMINDLLNYSRLAQHLDSAIREPVDLNATVEQVVDDLQIKLQECDGKVVWEALPTVLATPLHMRQLMQNLISNSLKFSRHGVAPVVRMSAEAVGDRWRITIQDNGLGLDMSQADRIFEPFQRLNSRTAYEGSGMGLAICKRIVEPLDGTIKVAESGPEGTTIVIELPRRRG